MDRSAWQMAGGGRADLIAASSGLYDISAHGPGMPHYPGSVERLLPRDEHTAIAPAPLGAPQGRRARPRDHQCRWRRPTRQAQGRRL